VSLDDLNAGAVPAAAASFQTHLLAHPRPNLAVLRPTLTTRFIGMLLLVMGVAAPVAMIGTNSYPPKPQGFFLLAAFVGLTAAGYCVAFVAGRYEFDRDFGEFRYRPWFRTHRRPLGDILAVQLADGGWHKVKNSRFHTTQMIVVLNEDPPARVCVTNHSHDEVTRTIARKLAVFLNVPFLDHSGGSKAGSNWNVEVEDGDTADGDGGP
jgi:hypothetical protein